MKESAYMTQTVWEFEANCGLVRIPEVCLHAY